MTAAETNATPPTDLSPIERARNCIDVIENWGAFLAFLGRAIQPSTAPPTRPTSPATVTAM
jgi:hypothetical protein